MNKKINSGNIKNNWGKYKLCYSAVQKRNYFIFMQHFIIVGYLWYNGQEKRMLEAKTMKHIKTINKTNIKNSLCKPGCKECANSCQSACKTSCTVANLACEN